MSTTSESSSHHPESPLLALEPRRVWHHFDELRRVPRPSKKEEKVVRLLLDWAAGEGLEAETDAAGNLVVRVPATPGHEEAPIVILQAHLDMVCEKSSGVDFDFDTDPIAVRLLEVEGETWVGAEGTTLGADNGVGVALALAAATDPEVIHGPLELLFTLDEETGLNGARALDGSLLRGRKLINLDAEEDDGVYIGCAGAAGLRAELSSLRMDPPVGTAPWTLSIRGLTGGHSGIDIHRNRANAIELLARLLASAIDDRMIPALSSFDGGDKGNALAREARAVLWLGEEEVEMLRARIEAMEGVFRRQYGHTDPDLRISFEPIEGADSTLVPADVPGPVDAYLATRWLRWLDALPHGPVALSADMEGLVETSANLASASTRTREAPRVGPWEEYEAVCTVLLSLRSSNNLGLDAFGQSIASLCRLAGARVERLEGYPGWQPNLDSPLLARTSAVYRRLFGRELAARAVHAGVECGVVAERIGELDAVSLGPEIVGAHSPGERVSVASVAKVWRWLSALLADLASEGASPRPR